MPRAVDLTGQRFGKLTAQWPVGRRGIARPTVLWLYSCECGAIGFASSWDLRKGKSASCGACVHRIHGYTSKRKMAPEYQAYYNARARCREETRSDYKNYGGRGIEFLFTSFEEFIVCLGERPLGFTLERIDNDGHYEPGNVRWATRAEQNLNQRRAERISQPTAL